MSFLPIPIVLGVGLESSSPNLVLSVVDTGQPGSGLLQLPTPLLLSLPPLPLLIALSLSLFFFLFFIQT